MKTIYVCLFLFLYGFAYAHLPMEKEKSYQQPYTETALLKKYLAELLKEIEELEAKNHNPLVFHKEAKIRIDNFIKNTHLISLCLYNDVYYLPIPMSNFFDVEMQLFNYLKNLANDPVYFLSDKVSKTLKQALDVIEIEDKNATLVLKVIEKVVIQNQLSVYKNLFREDISINQIDSMTSLKLILKDIETWKPSFVNQYKCLAEHIECTCLANIVHASLKLNHPPFLSSSPNFYLCRAERIRNKISNHRHEKEDNLLFIKQAECLICEYVFHNSNDYKEMSHMLIKETFQLCYIKRGTVKKIKKIKYPDEESK